MSDLLKLKQRSEESPQNELFRFSYAKALLDLRREEEAVSHLEWCLEKKPDWMVVVMLLGRIALKKGDVERAKGFYQRGLDLAVSQKHEGPESEIREILSRI